MLNTCLIAAFIGIGIGRRKVLASRQKSAPAPSRIGTRSGIPGTESPRLGRGVGSDWPPNSSRLGTAARRGRSLAHLSPQGVPLALRGNRPLDAIATADGMSHPRLPDDLRHRGHIYTQHSVM